MKVGIFISLATTLTFCCCTEQSPEEYVKVAQSSKKYFDEEKKKDGSNDFVFPDSTLNKLLIATYYEEDAGAHSIMFYTDNSKKFARVIRYLPDKTVLVDRITCTSNNEFASIERPELKYIVDADRIVQSYWRGDGRGIQYSFEHLRTDAARRD